MKAPLLQTIDIHKHYKQLRAVDGVSLDIDKGSCFGLLGPNGAGKTTLIEIIEDIIDPTEGEIRYKGKPRSAQFRQEIGIMFQQTALLSFLTVSETLQTFGQLYNITENLDQLIRLCHLDEVKDQPNDKVSGGQKQRLLLALALLNRPELVFLDEPSTGLDPQARRNLWETIDTVKFQGRTTVITTHYMEEAEQLCDDIAIMDKGKVIARGTPRELIRTHCKRTALSIPEGQFAEVVDAHNGNLPGKIRKKNGRVEIRTRHITELTDRLLSKGMDMSGVTITTPTLEDVFLKLTGRSLRE